MLMPSSVMLIALFGSPLMVELRAVPDVLNPGSEVSESSALRLVSGRLVICALLKFAEIDGDCVWTTSALSPTTLTLSSSAPTWSVTFTLAGTAAFSVTEFREAVLKPISDTVTEYVPPGSEAALKPPSEPETVLTSSPVPLFLIFTFAPGMTAPWLSTTVPDSDVKKLPCADAYALISAVKRTTKSALDKLDFIDRS